MNDIRFTASDPDRPITRDATNGVVTVPLIACDAQARAIGRLNLLLDAPRAESAHAGLTRALRSGAPGRRLAERQLHVSTRRPLPWSRSAPRLTRAAAFRVCEELGVTAERASAVILLASETVTAVLCRSTSMAMDLEILAGTPDGSPLVIVAVREFDCVDTRRAAQPSLQGAEFVAGILADWPYRERGTREAAPRECVTWFAAGDIAPDAAGGEFAYLMGELRDKASRTVVP